MAHYNVKPLRLMVRPSRWLAALFIMVSLAACVIVLCMPLHHWFNFFLAEFFGLEFFICLAIIAAASYAVAQHAWLVLPTGRWCCASLVQMAAACDGSQNNS